MICSGRAHRTSANQTAAAREQRIDWQTVRKYIRALQYMTEQDIQGGSILRVEELPGLA
jgi:hypothetical protein